MTRTYTLVSDVADRRAEQQRLAHLATHDHLTGLANRFLLLDRLHAVISLQRRAPSSAALLFLDLDGFKAVNDRFGHHAGDHALRTIATRLSDGSRTGDTVARLGGDEFVVLCVDTESHRADGHHAAESATERLRKLVEQPIRGDGWEVTLGVSVGWVGFSDGDIEPEALLARADEAMYRSKQQRHG